MVAVLVAFQVDSLTGDWNDLIGNSSAVASGFGIHYSSSGSMQACLGGVSIDDRNTQWCIGSADVDRAIRASFAGSIDEICHYNRELSAKEVHSICVAAERKLR